MTAHRLLYKSIRKDDGTYSHIPYDRIFPYRLIIVDEVSMLPKVMWELLLRHRRHVIALGDPGQLPPVMSEAHGILEHPHIFLDEIMRQEEESEIIRLTMDIRAGKPLQLQSGNEVRIVDQEELKEEGFLVWGDQILVGKNNTRHSINSFIRKILWEDDNPDPRVGDKIICLHNEWECMNDTDDALVNGLSGNIAAIEWPNDNPFMKKTPLITFQPDIEGSGVFPNLEVDYRIFTEHLQTVNRDNFKKVPIWYHPKEFDYAYAITCHKAQGSEYDKVIVLEEFLRGESKEDHMRWLYTAATRAAKKLIIVRNYRVV